MLFSASDSMILASCIEKIHTSLGLRIRTVLDFHPGRACKSSLDAPETERAEAELRKQLLDRHEPDTGSTAGLHSIL